MYLQFYGFKEAPFNLTPDSKFLFLSHRHQEALAALLFGVQERKGFICLTGEIGCGKTTLCRAMLSQLDPEQVKICVVLNSYLNDLELLKTINEGFTLPAESDSKKALIDTLNEFLVSEFSLGHNIVLIIDESQNLRPETLEQIRMISNLETETAKLIQIILIGQPELRKTLTLSELEQLNQRITVRYHITPLDEGEVAEYIRHRLAVAEPQVDVNFTPQAVRQIFHYSRGIPRRINVICDRCLLVGYVTGTFTIDDKGVERAVNEVQGDLGRIAVPSSSAAEARQDASAAASARRVRTMISVLKAAAWCLVIAFGIVLGTWWSNNRTFPLGRDGASAAREATPAAPADGKDAGKGKSGKSSRKKGKTPAADSAVVMGVVGPGGSATTVTTAMGTPKPTPRPSPTPASYANWQSDGDSVLRVATPNLGEAAAYLNLVRQWKIEVDLAPFLKATPTEVAQFDMLETVKQLNFRDLQADTFTEAFKLNLPMIVHLRAQDGKESWSVVSSANGEIVELVDPVSGKHMIKRTALEPQVLHAIVLYQDETGLAGLRPGDQGDQVIKLQEWLAGEGCFEGAPDGKYGPKTRDAMEKLQRKYNLKETGVIDPVCGAMIASKLNPRIPRLHP